MDNFLKKLGFVAYLEMEFPMSKEALLKKLRSKVDYGSDDFGMEIFISPKKKYLGIISNSIIQLDKKITFFNNSESIGRSIGSAREEDGKTILQFEIVIKPYFLIILSFILLLLITIGLIVINSFVILFIVPFSIFMYFNFKYAISITKKILKMI